MYVCMYVCMYGCVGSSFLCEGFLQLWQAGATPHRGARASHHRGLSLPRTGSRRAGSATVAHGPSRSAACGILPDQGSNPRSLHWQADSQPPRHQGSPCPLFLIVTIDIVGLMSTVFFITIFYLLPLFLFLSATLFLPFVFLIEHFI